MLRPVALHSCFFSSSLGYGWSEWRWSHSLRKSVTGFGSLPRLRGGRSTRLAAEAADCGERDGEVVPDMLGAEEEGRPDADGDDVEG